MKKEIKFLCNNEIKEISVKPGTPLLDVIRNDLRLTGTKEGCKEGDCGACTVIIGELNGDDIIYKTINSCLFPVAEIAGKHLVTIEGIQKEQLTKVQELFLEEGASQCGFCTPGFIVSITGHLLSGAEVETSKLTDSVAGNICRCTGHISIKRVIASFSDWAETKINEDENRINELIRLSLIPEYFAGVKEELIKMSSGVVGIRKQTKGTTKVAGGTDIYVQQSEGVTDYVLEILNENIPEQKIEIADGSLKISGLTTMSEIENSKMISETFPAIKEYLKYFGSRQIRNRATAGGNIRNASPIGDFSNILLALGAKLEITSSTKTREIELENFFISYKTVDCAEDETINKIIIQLPGPDFKMNFEKVSKREYLDIASVNSALFAIMNNNKINKVRISAGGVAPIPLYLKQTSAELKNKEINPETIKKAASVAMEEISPISDARGSKEYKRLLMRQLIYLHFIKLFPNDIRAEELI